MGSRQALRSSESKCKVFKNTQTRFVFTFFFSNFPLPLPDLYHVAMNTILQLATAPVLLREEGVEAFGELPFPYHLDHLVPQGFHLDGLSAVALE